VFNAIDNLFKSISTLRKFLQSRRLCCAGQAPNPRGLTA
jgi:hypothetical protein